MSPERTENIKSYMKNNAANYLILRNTNQTLLKIQDAQKRSKPLFAQGMKAKKD